VEPQVVSKTNLEAEKRTKRGGRKREEGASIVHNYYSLTRTNGSVRDVCGGRKKGIDFQSFQKINVLVTQRKDREKISPRLRSI